MKATMSTPSRNPLRHTAFKAAACAATLAALLALATSARAQTDNFDSGTENPAAGWGHISDPNYPATYTFPTDALGGHAYRLQGAVPVTATNGSGTTIQPRRQPVMLKYLLKLLMLMTSSAMDSALWP